ncbi:MAG: phosphodiester glycosidase family protein [Cyclonatronaceae bacterium]
MKHLLRTLLFVSLLCLIKMPAPADAQDTTHTVVGPGITYTYIDARSPNLRITSLKIDISRPENKITTVLANDRLSLGNELVGNMSTRNTGNDHLVIGAINGDYFGSGPYGKLSDGQIIEGEYVFGGYRNRSSFGMTADGMPIVDILNFDGELRLADESTFRILRLNRDQANNALVLYNYYTGNTTRSDDTATEWRLRPLEDLTTNAPVLFEVIAVERHQGNMTIGPEDYVLTGTGAIADSLYGGLTEGDEVHITMKVVPARHDELAEKQIAELMGGGPRLLTNGEHSADEFVGFEGFGENHSGERHPRSAVGFSEDSTIVIFAVVDGRQHYSRGATMEEMATIMQGLGAWNAINLDGGGSSTLVVRDEYKNNHDWSFGLGSYRSVANGLLAVAEVSYADIGDSLAISPGHVAVDTAETTTFSASLFDIYGFELPGADEEVTWELVDLEGEISDDGHFTANEYGRGYLVAHFGAFSDTATVYVRDPVGVEPVEPGTPESFILNQNYPNPFNPDTRITFELPVASHVRITVYDILGRPVSVLTDEQHLPGVHAVRFDAGNLSSGTYIYEIVAGDFTARRSMMLIK